MDTGPPTQTDFCNRAQPSYGCNNQPATLDDMARGRSSLGMAHTGSGLNSAATFNQVYTDVKAARPVAARIGWTPGGGHMNLVHGFDTSNTTIAVADPWPDTATYTWWKYNDYVSNSSSKWAHSRIGISRQDRRHARHQQHQKRPPKGRGCAPPACPSSSP
ncbi:papain-like cysteine protease family protein [Streptomyces sp. NPDC017988]|uniref:papain-like cysteine protease family protein n=1 Tax=Streptomyces sp. NPDC017988 TaxID=3365025 RepID=UPI003797522B